MEATIFHSSLLMSFFSFFLVTCTSLRTLFNSMSCLSSASFVMTSIEWAALLGADNAGVHEFVSSSSMDCKLLSNLWNSLGSPVVDKASLSKPDSLGSDDTVLERLLTQYGELVVQGFDRKSPGELKHLWRVMGWEMIEFRLSNSISSRTSSCSWTCFSMAFMSPAGTLTRTIFASQFKTITLIHLGISVTEGLL